MVEPNSQLGSYRLGERLGRGGTADVFKAFQAGVERDVAVKVMFSHLADNPEFAPRFQREARAMGQLQHPNIARVIDFDATADPPFMVMEFLAGGSLADLLLDRPGPLPIDRALRITRQLAEALRYAHRLGMVHRDIKPGNVMFTDDEQRHAVLMDFGMARLVDEGLTASGTVLGTPAYMAPEQVRGEGASAPADLYSLGVLLYQLVTGELPYQADSVHSLMLKHTTEPIPSAAAANSSVPAALDHFLTKAMAKQPVDRFESADALLVALDALGAAAAAPVRPSVTSGANATIVSQTSPTPGTTSSRRVPVLAATAVVAAIAVAAATFLFANRGGDSDATDEVSAEVLAADVSASSVPAAQPGYGSSSQQAPAAPLPTPPDAAAGAGNTHAAGVAQVAYFERLTALVADDPLPLSIVSVAVLDGRIAMAVERARQPAAGFDWVLWLETRSEPIGHFVRPDDHGRGRVDYPDVAASEITGVTLSEEPVGSALTRPTSNMFTSSLPPALREDFDRRAGLLQALQPQVDLAVEHAGFIGEEVTLNDLAQVHRHAEHVVNILAGAESDVFGDLDQSGLAENPGDGIGIEAYGRAIAGLAPLPPDGFVPDWHEPIGAAIERLALRAQRQGADIAASRAASDAANDVSDIERTLELIDSDSRRFARSLDTALVRAALGDLLATGASDSVGSLAVTGDVDALLIQLELAPGVVAKGQLPQGGELVFDELGRSSITLPGQIGPVAIGVQDEVLGDLVASLDDSLVERFEALAGSSGSLAGLVGEVQIASELADLLAQAGASGDHDGSRALAEQLIIVLEGAAGEHAGDMDGDGIVREPGDGTGVLVYLDQVAALVDDFPNDTIEQTFYRGVFGRTVNHLQTATRQAIDDGALRVLATDTTDEAQPFIDAAAVAIATLVGGGDLDNNGVVDVIAAEGGALSLQASAASLLSTPIFRE